LLLSEHRGEFACRGVGMATGSAPRTLFTHHIESTLSDTAHKRNRVFFFLQSAAQRPKFAKRQRRGVDGWW
jgi:hypothetical protein